MTIDEQIGTFLNANAGLIALIGPGAVWLCMLPQGQKKGVVYEQISGPREVTLDCRVRTDARWQFTSYAESAVAARKIHDALLAALEFFRGSFVTDGLYVECDVPEDERGPMFDYERNLYRYDADFVFSY